MQQDSMKLGFRRISCSVILLTCGIVVHAGLPRVTAIRETGSSRSATTFISPRQFLIEHLFNPWGRRLDVLGSTGFSLSRNRQVSRTYGPLRQITFLGGDRISSEIVRWGNDLVELRLRCGQAVAVPREAISRICVPPGETELLSEDFESATVSPAPREQLAVKASPIDISMLDSSRSASGSRCLRLNAELKPFILEFPDLPQARVQFWFRVDTPADSIISKSHTAARVEFEFRSSLPTKWRVDLAPSTVSISSPAESSNSITPQTLRLGGGWHCLTTIVTANRSMCLVDDSLLFFDTRSPGALRSVHFSAATASWIDSLLVSKLNGHSTSEVACPSTPDDVVSTADGTQFFGRIKLIDQTGVLLGASEMERLFRWDQIVGIGLRQPDRQVREQVAAPVGLQAEIEFQSLVDRPGLASDRITVSILEVNKDYLIVVHPWLGTIAVAWTEIGRVHLRFFGESVLLDARQMHLGDSIQADFHRQVPDGIEWSGEFELPSSARSQTDGIWLVVDVAELEPSGPDTPPASPFLRELRTGQLLTELTINEQPAGNLNRLLRFRSKPEHPEQLRLPLPQGLARSGHNTFRIKQRPLLKSGRYDNCELSNLRLEIVAPPLPD